MKTGCFQVSGLISEKKEEYKYFVIFCNFAIQLASRCKYQINDYRDVFRTQSSSYDRIFCDSSKRLKAVNYYCKDAPSQMFHWVLSTPQDWLLPNDTFIMTFYLYQNFKNAAIMTCILLWKNYFLKKHQITLIQSYFLPVTMDNRIIWNKVTDLINRRCHSKYVRWIEQCYLVIVASAKHMTT